jgi:3',5'-cyclic AMP phosphodiesterase CpdA
MKVPTLIHTVVAAVLVAAVIPPALSGEPRSLPNRAESVKFAVIGDSGNGKRPQYEVAAQLASQQAEFPFELVIMLGDNLYGGQQPEDFVAKFEKPYAALLGGGVRFFAALGNHDHASNRFYPSFNMSGDRYYTFARRNVRFFVLDTTVFDAEQRAWIERELAAAPEEWKVCYFHHPLYSNGIRHGSQLDLRPQLEPLFVKYGVQVVFSGHDHVYERITPQQGVQYFVSGAGGQLRKGGVRPSATTAAYFDQDQSFMLVEIAGSDLFFNAVSRTGQIVDSGAMTTRTTR